MELIFKLPLNKLPFLGILYESIYAAETENRDLVNNGYNTFEIILIPSGDKMNLKLKCHDNNSIHWYKDLKYSKHELIKWIKYATGEFNFGHIREKEDKHIIVYTLPARKQFVLKIERIFIEEEF